MKFTFQFPYSGKKSSYFKKLTEKFESMSATEKDKIRQDQLDDMKVFISKMSKVSWEARDF